MNHWTVRKNVFVATSGPDFNPSTGFLTLFKQQSTDVTKNITLSSNSQQGNSIPVPYNKILTLNGECWQGYHATENVYLKITFNHHLIQLTSFKLGQPTESCYGSVFNVVGVDEQERESPLGTYSTSSYDFCMKDGSPQTVCTMEGERTFKIANPQNVFYKSIKFVGTKNSCTNAGVHFAVRGVELYGTLIKPVTFKTCKVNRQNSRLDYSFAF